MTITHIFFDIGGVLGSRGWDTGQRALAARRFGLAGICSAFFSSCWLGVAKPSRRIYELALSMSQATPEHSVFIDDLAENLTPARALGMRTVRFTGADQLAADLAAMGIATDEGGYRPCDLR